jgi:hypothetical protein
MQKTTGSEASALPKGGVFERGRVKLKHHFRCVLKLCDIIIQKKL